MQLMVTCPYCGIKSAQDAPRARPAYVPGDRPSLAPKQAALCRECGGIAVATPSMVGFQLRMPTTEEMDEMDEDELIIALRARFEQAFGKAPEPWRR